MNQKGAEPKKFFMNVGNGTVPIKGSLTTTIIKIFIRVRNRSIKALFALVALEAVIALFAVILGHFVPYWLGIIIAVALPVGATVVFHRRVSIEVHEISK